MSRHCNEKISNNSMFHTKTEPSENIEMSVIKQC